MRCAWAGQLTTKPSASAVNRLARTRKPRNPSCGRLLELVLNSTCFTSISGVFTLNLFFRQVRHFYSFLVLIITEKNFPVLICLLFACLALEGEYL